VVEDRGRRARLSENSLVTFGGDALVANRGELGVPPTAPSASTAHSDLLRYDVANQIIVRKDAPKKGKVAPRRRGGGLPGRHACILLFLFRMIFRGRGMVRT
jgi:hypothetical protein